MPNYPAMKSEMLWITARGGHVGVSNFVFVYVRSFGGMFAAGRRWHHRGSCLVFYTNKGKGWGACPPPSFYSSVLSHNVPSHLHLLDMQTLIHSHTVCVCGRPHTQLSKVSHLQARTYTIAHTPTGQ
jgi:hypothetical protein